MGKRQRVIGVVQDYTIDKIGHAVKVDGLWHGIPDSLIFSKKTRMLPGEYLVFEYEDKPNFRREITQIFLRTAVITGGPDSSSEKPLESALVQEAVSNILAQERLEALRVAGQVVSGLQSEALLVRLEGGRSLAIQVAKYTTDVADVLLKWLRNE